MLLGDRVGICVLSDWRITGIKHGNTFAQAAIRMEGAATQESENFVHVPVVFHISSSKRALQIVQGSSLKSHSYSLSAMSLYLNSPFGNRVSKKSRRSFFGIMRIGLSWLGQDISTFRLARSHSQFFLSSSVSSCQVPISLRGNTQTTS